MFSLQKQFDLLNNISSYWEQFKSYLIVTSLFIILIVICIYFYYKNKKTSVNSEWLFLYLQALDLLANKGIYKDDSTTAKAFCDQLNGKVLNRVENKSHASEIVKLFIELSHTFNQLQFTKNTNEQESVKVIPLFSKRNIIYISSIAAAILLLFNLNTLNKSFNFDSLDTETVDSYILNNFEADEIASLFSSTELSETNFIDYNLNDETLDYYLESLDETELILE